MNVTHQKELAAQVLKIGKNRIIIDSNKLAEVHEAITKGDVRSLMARGLIRIRPIKGHSRFHARKIKLQKRKGRRKGRGSKKGSKTSVLSRKRNWIIRVRTQREFIKNLKNKRYISNRDYRNLYSKIKSNRFRSIRLIKLYINENNMIIKNDLQKKAQRKN